MDYELERKKDKQPCLAEMTEAAIKVLEQGDDGFMLLVEGSRIPC